MASSPKHVLTCLCSVGLALWLGTGGTLAQRRSSGDDDQRRPQRAPIRPAEQAPTRGTAPNLTVGEVVSSLDQLPELSLTWVVTGLFNESDQSTRTRMHITSPYVMPFRWGTGYQEAVHGRWRLRRLVGTRLGATEPTFEELASGVAGPAHFSQFTIDLRDHLPATPPSAERTYHVEVVARDASGGSPGTGRAAVMPSASEVGPWSAPVIITYGQNTTPSTQFDFDEVYTRARLVLDEIEVVRDQYGPGQEEYYVRGFVQELFMDCQDTNPSECRFSTPGRQYEFGADTTAGFDCDNGGPYFRCLSPPVSSEFGSIPDEPAGWRFVLTDAPRRLVLTMSMLEEDSGDSVREWGRGFDRLADLGELADLYRMHQDEIEEFVNENAEEILEYVIDGIQVVNSVATAAAGPFAGAVIAVVAITEIVTQIYGDSADDYYGTQATALTLSSNQVGEVHKLPGRQVGQTYVTDIQSLRFYGSPGVTSAGSFDGIVDITYHWEFTNREIN